MYRFARTVVATIAWSCLLVRGGTACPFCSSVSQTLTEEMNSMQAVAVAMLTEAPPVPAAGAIDPDGPLPKAKFLIQDVIKGGDYVRKGETIEVLFFGEAKKDRPYLLMGTDPPQIVWSTPLGLSQRAYRYILRLPTLPTDHQRLEFFQDFLEDQDEMLARDAYDEFAKAPYADVIALKDKMNHDALIAWIQNPNVPASRRRLYFTMLGVCGTPADAPLLRSMMTSNDRQAKAGLDALIACYLLLTPDQGLKEVEAEFLKNKDAEYADTYAAIMAIRFHGNQADRIDKQRLVRSLRYLLERPELADLVIPDLARWQDWEVMPRLVQLFKEADEKSSWVRVPVVNYLRSCPLPEAKKQIEELSKIDAEAVKRAETYFPFDKEGDGGAASAQPSLDESSQQAPPTDASLDVAGGERPILDGATTRTIATVKSRSLDPVISLPEAGTAATEIEASAGGEDERPGLGPNRWAIVGVPVIAGVVLMFVLRLILGYPLLARLPA